MYLRHVTLDDHPAILDLARQAGFGMTSLPPDEAVLRQKIEKAVASATGDASMQGRESFLFVLIDPADDAVVGTCGIKCHVGVDQPFYSYKLSTITQFCHPLSIMSHQKVLHMVNDYNGASEIGSLFLSAEYRRDRIGRFLSRIRFLFIAQFRQYFDERLISEIRGMHDAAGHSPFYDSIARHFFQMEFTKADYINATQGNQFIADLMPKYPIYVNLLPLGAQETIGRPYIASEAAKAMLEREGFRYNHYLDVFDGGPTLEAITDQVRTVQDSRPGWIVEIVPTLPPETEKYMLGTTELAGFRAAVDGISVQHAEEPRDKIVITEKTAATLGVGVGDTVRYVKA